MPELPEVETVARELREVLVGRIITGVTARWPRTVAVPALEDFEAKVVGRRIEAVGRRGKYVVVGLDQGYLLIHLKMSGRLLVVPGDTPLDAYSHTLFDLDNHCQLRFRDTRKFGRVYLVDNLEQITGRLGPEPLADSFSFEGFCQVLAQRRGRLKPLLLNQQFLAGLGNIYADESLFAARLHPLRQADSLDPEEQRSLYQAIRTVLSRAVAGRGTTLEDSGYVDARGQPGDYQRQIAVYGRKAQPCLVCGTPIERIVLGGRSTHFCPCCQSLEGKASEQGADPPSTDNVP